MRKASAILFVLVLVGGLSAQQRTGNIAGTVVDQEGNILPGVAVTLTGATIAPMSTATNAEGRFRFLSLFPANDYQVKLELQGFKTKIETGVIVNINFTAELKLVMEQGRLEEQITVVATTPVIQAKKTQVTHNINYEQLQELPSARDPWVILQLTPSVFIDRENIGGTESGQQSSFMAKGSTTQEWTLDGMQITDRNSGGSPGYFDFDAFEEMQISTGSLDVEHRDPGVVINLVSRRGGNKMSLGGRFFYTDEKFQREVSAGRIKELGVSGYNKAVDIKDFGFNAGGPVLRDKIWWWVGYGIQQIQTVNILNVRDDTYLNNYNAKVNFQLIPENRAEFMFTAGEKVKFGRSSSASFPPGWNQGSQFHFGNPTFKFQDEHMFGDNLFLSFRGGKSNAGFGMWPANDLDITKPRWYDVEKTLYYNSNTWFYSDRPHPYYVFQTQYFNDDFLGTGTSHEMKIGFEINHNSRTYVGGYPGNFHVYHNYNTETVDWNLDGQIDKVRDQFGIDIRRIYLGSNDLNWSDGTKRWAVYFNDAISVGRLNLNFGLRADRGWNYINPLTTKGIFTDQSGTISKYQDNYTAIAAAFFTPEAVAKLAAMIPPKNRDYIEPGKKFWFLSPRLGLTYDLFGDGKTIAKAAYSLYKGGGLGTTWWTPYGMYGSMNFWWVDANKDNKASLNELYWGDYSKSSRPAYRVFDDAGNFVGNHVREYSLHWSGWNWDNPTGLSNPVYYIDLDKWKTSLTHEVFFSLEREIMHNFGASLSYTWKRMGRWSESRSYYPLEFYPTLGDHVRSKDDYEIGGYVPETLANPATGATWDPGEAKGRPWYVLKNAANTMPTAYYKTEMMDPKRRNIYWGVDLVLTKRLSNKWMLNGSVTYQMQRTYYGDDGYTDPTNIWAYEGAIYGVSMGGGSGKVSRAMFSRWMFKMMGLYQLPWDLTVSGTVSAHEGSFFATTFGVQDRTLPNSRSYSNTLPTATYDNRSRLGDVWVINLKVEKMIRLGDVSRMYFSADLFNILNGETLLRKYDISYGTFRYAGGPNPATTTFHSWTAPGATSGLPNEILNPMVMRLGMRFQI